MNLDRFQLPVDDLPVHECDFCGLEIYTGDIYFEEDGRVSCEDADCIARLARLEKRRAQLKWQR